MLREETVFGPISSRRLGNSLGINLLPEKGKICNFDCIYCECGWNKDGRDDTDIPTAAKVHKDLEAKLQQIRNNNVEIDSITFSGDGEPTLNPEFPRIINETIQLRATYYPNAKISVLSNATRVNKPDILNALQKVDNPIMKIDAPTNELAQKINNPAPGYDVRTVVESLKGFNGNFVLQTMFLRSPDFDSSSPEVLNGWMDIVRELHPREVMVYTIARPTPANNLQKFTEEEMHTLLEPLFTEGFVIQIRA
ncbi:MAG: radical SAM protein [Bacteroidales bacterium]|nr:radical SAM protein [Bacteroidales bacterium]